MPQAGGNDRVGCGDGVSPSEKHAYPQCFAMQQQVVTTALDVATAFSPSEKHAYPQCFAMQQQVVTTVPSPSS